MARRNKDKDMARHNKHKDMVHHNQGKDMEHTARRNKDGARAALEEQDSLKDGTVQDKDRGKVAARQDWD
jgi:hypothetical protein